MDHIDTKVVSVIIGIVLGALISTIGYMLKIYQEKRKSLNSALYESLEIYSAVLSTIMRDEYYFMHKCYSRESYLTKFSDEDMLYFKEQHTVMHSFFDRNIEENMDTLLEKYNELIKKVSFYKPILAYELSLSIDPLMRLESARSFINENIEVDDNARDFWTRNGNYDAAMEKIKAGTFYKTSHNQLTSLINTQSIKIAKEIGYLTRRKVLQKLESSIVSTDEKYNEKIDSILDARPSKK